MLQSITWAQTHKRQARKNHKCGFHNIEKLKERDITLVAVSASNPHAHSEQQTDQDKDISSTAGGLWPWSRRQTDLNFASPSTTRHCFQVIIIINNVLFWTVTVKFQCASSNLYDWYFATRVSTGRLRRAFEHNVQVQADTEAFTVSNTSTSFLK